MPTPAASALSAAVIAGIEDLELAARLVVEGLRAGEHRSPFHGYSAEFQQHRAYRPGDDLKYLDWKLLGRTDRLYSRQFRETTSMPVTIVLDASASMAFPENAVTKFRCATVLAASLAYLIVSQGDAVGLVTMSGGAIGYLPPRGGRLHLRTLVARLDRTVAAGAWASARAISLAAELQKRRGGILVISDFYDAHSETMRELRRATLRGQDVTMLQILSPSELRLPYDGDVEVEDLESGLRTRLDAKAARADYNAAVAGFVDRCRQEALRAAIDHELVSTDTPPSHALRRYLLRRGARHRSHQSARRQLG